MTSSLKVYLKTILSGELPGNKAHQKLLPPGRILRVPETDRNLVTQSSVLVLLFPENGKLFTCLTKRPSTMKNHPGQISFPGGKVEQEDESAERTALREAQEEVGIRPSQIEILGKLSDFYLEVSRFTIQPFLAWCDSQPFFEANNNEVDELILFPISDFVVDEQIRETQLQTVTGMLRIKYFPYEGHVVWGATAMILAELIEILKQSELFEALRYDTFEK